MPPPEEWRDAEGYPGYQVSSEGRVRGKRGNVLSQHTSTTGYLRVGLHAPRGHVNAKVHHLVAAAFIGPRPAGMEVCHVDGVKTRNAAANLRYGTPSENILDQVAHGTHNMASKTHCPQGHPYDVQNTLMEGSFRRCRACRLDRVLRRRSRQLSAAPR